MRVQFRVLFCLLLIGVWGKAQYVNGFSPIQWIDASHFLANSKLSFTSYEVNIRGEVQVLSRPGAQAGAVDLQSVAAKGAPGQIYRAGHECFCQQFGPGSDPSKLKSKLLRQEGKEWVTVGVIETPRKLGRILISPTESENRFLGISKLAFGDKKSPFALLGVNTKGEFEVRSLMESGVESFEDTQRLVDALPLALIVHTPDYITLIVQESGLYWSFKRSTGSLAHFGRIYSSVSNAMVKAGLPLQVVQHAQPTPEGQILWCARSEDAIQEGKTVKADLDRLQNAVGQASSEERGKWIKAWKDKQSELMQHQPFVAWFEFNPAAGTFIRLNPPPAGAREVISSFEEAAAFHWVPLPARGIMYVGEDFQEFNRIEQPRESINLSKPATKIRKRP